MFLFCLVFAMSLCASVCITLVVGVLCCASLCVGMHYFVFFLILQSS